MPKIKTIEEIEKEFDKVFSNNVYEQLGFDDYDNISEKVLSFLRTTIEQRDEAHCDNVQGFIEEIDYLKPTERKVAHFGDWRARTYEEEMLVKAVLDEVIEMIKNKK